MTDRSRVTQIVMLPGLSNSGSHHTEVEDRHRVNLLALENADKIINKAFQKNDIHSFIKT